MKCTFCGHEFNEEEGRLACSECHLVKGCELIRCPNCNFELAPDPQWIQNIRKKLSRKRESKNER